jgi:uncharacterized membrane protein
MRRQAVSWVSCAALLVLAACSREPAPTPEPTAPELAFEDAVAPPEQLPPADSGLEIKRGMLTLEKGRKTFQSCGEVEELWVLDQAETSLEKIFGSELRPDSSKLYIEAYGERGAAADDIPDAKGYAGMFVLEEVLFATIEGAARACDQPMPTYIVAARGNEPFWSIEVDETQLIWRSPEAPKELTLQVEPAHYAEGAVRYIARGGDHELELLLDAQPCRDSMSGDFFAYAARAVFDGEELRGCARVGK